MSERTAARRFTVTAHSGAFGTPDNSAEYIKKALAENCDVLEMDVTFRPSGTPVLIHKEAPGETEGVLLEDALRLIAAHPAARLNLDLKSTVNLPAVDALLKEYGLFERAFYTGVTPGWAQKVQVDSAVPYYLNTDICPLQRRSIKRARALAEKLVSLGAVGLNVHYKSVSPTVVRAVHEQGLPVSLWTANTRAAMRRCISLGADNITTRRPDELFALIGETERQVPPNAAG